ncbi:hypothetical protein PAAG_11888 [Paracoccidioides lutzii Pb01]|uniref:Uncharacterized protein n=1 Tax=Paracoccidioides lutzii (strain ATCC MYA-826 / Pb01) TaxID=502779 RepID=A0A0A2V4X6_PARBA|nr:hypothetical protein PAAG_11888 [Paracoccidioides lutzii Pb01]KGQ01422.1 hypothetical protein PAAG_11888 [Paracoccidioides lutzii Pb01]
MPIPQSIHAALAEIPPTAPYQQMHKPIGGFDAMPEPAAPDQGNGGYEAERSRIGRGQDGRGREERRGGQRMKGVE